MILLEPEIVRQVLRGKRQMVRVPTNGKKPKPGGCTIRGRSSALKCAITITSVEDSILDDQPVWTIRFTRGVDEDRYPAQRVGGAGGDYTSIPSRKLNGTGAEVSAHELSRYALTAHESHENGLQERRERLLSVIGQIRLEMARQGIGSPLARKRLKSVEHELRKLATGRRHVA